MADNEKRHSGDHSTVGHKEVSAKSEKAAEAKPATTGEPAIPPVNFSKLFRFSTPFELTLDAIGLVAAAAAGK
jgi:ATP-binding cassette subfamily B (MDR/TAP) protein 1